MEDEPMNKLYNYTLADEKTIEVIVNEDVVMINHMILPKGDCLPVHKANSNVYMIVADGEITLELNGSKPVTYKKGSIINIEYDTQMNACNKTCERTELFVVKAPGPAKYSAV
jgi:quercetin dioxygenase-like cupin family protein